MVPPLHKLVGVTEAVTSVGGAFTVTEGVVVVTVQEPFMAVKVYIPLPPAGAAIVLGTVVPRPVPVGPDQEYDVPPETVAFSVRLLPTQMGVGAVAPLIAGAALIVILEPLSLPDTAGALLITRMR